jgi:hypothetical protein
LGAPIKRRLINTEEDEQLSNLHPDLEEEYI